MREIKFRGKRVDNGEWEFGFFVKDATSSTVYIENYAAIEYTGSNCYHEVHPESVGQYTGIKDIYGNAIYEGDKLQWTHKYECQKIGKPEATDCHEDICTGIVYYSIDGGFYISGLSIKIHEIERGIIYGHGSNGEFKWNTEDENFEVIKN